MAKKIKEFTYEITEELGTIEERGNLTYEVNKISWNSRPALLDIRKFRHNGDEVIMDKGISLSDEACIELFKILKDNGYGTETEETEE